MSRLAFNTISTVNVKSVEGEEDDEDEEDADAEEEDEKAATDSPSHNLWSSSSGNLYRTASFLQKSTTMVWTGVGMEDDIVPVFCFSFLHVLCRLKSFLRVSPNMAPTIPPMGFLNPCAICYFNALVQCLLSCTHFVDWVHHHRKQPHRMLGMFDQFFSFIEADQWDTLFPLRLLEMMEKVASNQSSSEYFLNLLHAFSGTRLEEELFVYKFQLEQTCRGCGYTPPVRYDVTTNPLVTETFQELMEHTEEISDVLCDGCKSRQPLVRRRTLIETPLVMAVSLNKYFSKRAVDCPSEFRFHHHRYRLRACVDHRGVLGSGHYVARCIRAGQAMMCDDSKIHPIQGMDTHLADTYMMFYERDV